MRTIWLASTALLISTGLACAQTAESATPAPTGSLASPQVSPTPNASPGNMAPSASNSGYMGMPTTASNGVASPAPNGAASAPNVTAAAPNASPGKMAPNAGSGSSTAMAASAPTHPWHHQWSKSGALPAEASAADYLHIANAAIQHHNVSLADDALSHAETRLLNRSVPQGQVAADDTPSIQSIESARQALHAGNYSQASADTKQAASTVTSM